MDYGHILSAAIGFSASFLFCLPSLKRRHRQQVAMEKLRITSEALERAEERVVKFQERHDQVLRQMCTFYLSHQELEETLRGARAAMNDALEFAVKLRDVQLKILIHFPDEADLSKLHHGSYANPGRTRNH